jgi:hypothetical protein
MEKKQLTAIKISSKKIYFWNFLKLFVGIEKSLPDLMKKKIGKKKFLTSLKICKVCCGKKTAPSNQNFVQKKYFWNFLKLLVTI